MTEAEWLMCDDPQRMRAFLGDRASDRRLCRFLLTCAHEVWGHQNHAPTRLALETAGQLVNRDARHWGEPVRIASGQAVLDCGATEPYEPLWTVHQHGIPKPILSSSISATLVEVLDQLACHGSPPLGDGLVQAFDRLALPRARQAALFRDIVRWPFRTLTFQARWRTANGATCMQVVETIEAEQAFDQLPILADALLDAGCDSEEILAHLRSQGPHAPGCWALDVIAGRF